MVIIDNIEMMKLQWDELTEPFYQAALLALVLLSTFLKQSAPQPMRECIS